MTVVCPYSCLNLGSFATLFKLPENCICDQKGLQTLELESALAARVWTQCRLGHHAHACNLQQATQVMRKRSTACVVSLDAVAFLTAQYFAVCCTVAMSSLAMSPLS